jgi:23S rRNA (cytidine1920-2'-O)/16S rRNA (cytidine1409-2'-O)-methyltransferase
VASPLPGPSGNVEFFLWLRRGAPAADADQIRAVVEEASR